MIDIIPIFKTSSNLSLVVISHIFHLTTLVIMMMDYLLTLEDFRRLLIITSSWHESLSLYTRRRKHDDLCGGLSCSRPKPNLEKYETHVRRTKDFGK